MRLIDADKTIGLLKTRLYETALNNATVNCDASQLYSECADNRIEAWIDEMPTVDAVEVVRCRDCKWFVGERCRHKRSNLNDSRKPTDFCSWGERREDDNK